MDRVEDEMLIVIYLYLYQTPAFLKRETFEIITMNMGDKPGKAGSGLFA